MKCAVCLKGNAEKSYDFQFGGHNVKPCCEPCARKIEVTIREFREEHGFCPFALIPA